MPLNWYTTQGRPVILLGNSHFTFPGANIYDDFRIVHVYLEVKKLEKVYMGWMRSDI